MKILRIGCVVENITWKLSKYHSTEDRTWLQVGKISEFKRNVTVVTSSVQIFFVHLKLHSTARIRTRKSHLEAIG